VFSSAFSRFPIGTRSPTECLTFPVACRTLLPFRQFFVPEESYTPVQILMMGQTVSLYKILVGFPSSLNDRIFPPKKVEYSISKDGKEFRKAGEGSPSLKEPADIYRVEIRDASLAVAPMTARHDRVKTHSVMSCPTRHPGCGKNTCVVCDEKTIDQQAGELDVNSKQNITRQLVYDMQKPMPSQYTYRLIRLLILFMVLACAGCAAVTGNRASDTPTLRIMTWNIRYDNPDDGIHAWPKRSKELLSYIQSQRIDLLCVQEGLHAQVVFLKDGQKGFDVCGVGRDDGKEKGEYSAIYFNEARFGYLADGTFWLSPTPSVPSMGWDAALPRIVTWVRLYDSLSAAIFTVFNTHFDHMGVQARENSARLLRSKIGEIAGKSQFILAGDFNSGVTDAPYLILTSRDGDPPYLTDAMQRAITPHRGPSATFTGFAIKDPDPGDRIDYLFVSESVQVDSHCTCVARRPEGYLSDHLPVLVELSLVVRPLSSWKRPSL